MNINTKLDKRSGIQNTTIKGVGTSTKRLCKRHLHVFRYRAKGLRFGKELVPVLITCTYSAEPQLETTITH